MKTITDVFTVQLSNNNIDGGNLTNATYRLNIPNKRMTGYDKITMYCDAFNADLYNLDVNTVLIQASGFYQKNSLSVITKGSARTIGQCSRPIYRNASNNVVEKLDNVEFYAPNTPIPISSIPDETTISLVTIATGSATIDLQTNTNFYHLRLRFVCEYTSHNC